MDSFMDFETNIHVCIVFWFVYDCLLLCCQYVGWTLPCCLTEPMTHFGSGMDRSLVVFRQVSDFPFHRDRSRSAWHVRGLNMPRVGMSCAAIVFLSSGAVVTQMATQA